MADMRNNCRGMSARMNRGMERGYGVGEMRMSTHNCKGLMRKLQVIDFAIIDASLYLDAYPECAAALDYYKRLVKEREEIRKIMNENGCPVTTVGGISDGKWSWVSGPWPWEPDAN